jgi:hypothetical protein
VLKGILTGNMTQIQVFFFGFGHSLRVSSSTEVASGTIRTVNPNLQNPLDSAPLKSHAPQQYPLHLVTVILIPMDLQEYVSFCPKAFTINSVPIGSIGLSLFELL